MEIKTTITNRSRIRHSLTVARGKCYTLRPGETMTLDYDLWSLLAPAAKRNLQKIVNKGVLEINTKINAGSTSMSIDNADGQVVIGPEESVSKPPAKTRTKAKAKVKTEKPAEAVKSDTEKDLIEKNSILKTDDETQTQPKKIKEHVVKTEAGLVTSKSQKKLKSFYGIDVDVDEQDKALNLNGISGKTKVSKSNNQFFGPMPNLESAKAAQLINKNQQ